MKQRTRKTSTHVKPGNPWVILTILGTLFLLILVGMVVVGNRKTSKGRVMGTSSIAYPPLPVSSWLWNSPTQYSTQSATLLLQNARQNDISTIYLSLDEYLSITQISDPTLRATRLSHFTDSLANFITIANANNIAVQGLTGNPNWISSPYSSLPPLFVDYVIGFNQTHGVRLEGIQFDIEFYSLSSTKKQLDTAAVQYLTLINNLLTQVKAIPDASALKLGFTIPFFFDTSTYTIAYNGTRQVLAYQLLDLLNTYPYSYLAIMDYRNFTDGSNGSITLVQNELGYAQTHAPNVGIYLGQETSNVQPSYTTFYGLGKPALFTAISQLYSYFQANPTLKGFSTNDLPNYLAL